MGKFIRWVVYNIRALIKTIFFISQFGTVIERSKIKPQKQSKGIFVLGNGPSTQNLFINHPEKLNNNEMLVVNHFAQTEYYCKYKPKYYIVVDRGFYADKSEMPDVVSEKVHITLERIEKLTTWDMTLLIPLQGKKSNNILNLAKKNAKIKISFISLFQYKGWKSLERFLLDRQFIVFSAQNVLIPAIQFAFYFGYKNIYLIGAENDWTQKMYVDEQNRLMIREEHFYSKEENGIMVTNLDGSKYFLWEVMRDLMVVFKAYIDVNEYLQTRGVHVLNCTEGSYIEAFERIKLSDIQ